MRNLKLSVHRGYITRDLTDANSANGHTAPLHDPEASFRVDLTAKLAGAQINLENKLAELRARITTGADNIAIAQAVSQLRGLGDLRQRIEQADASTLASLQSEVNAALAVTRSVSDQTASASPTLQAGQLALNHASEVARHSVEDFESAYYRRHVFDQYLQFSSQRDEEEYRRREQDRHQEIEKAMAERTPQGDLRASQLSIDQLKDAGAHGAVRSPEYQKTLDGLTAARDKLAAQIEPAKETQSSKTDGFAAPTTSQAVPAPVPGDVLAQIKAAKIVVADQHQEGHGVAQKASQPGGSLSL